MAVPGVVHILASMAVDGLYMCVGFYRFVFSSRAEVTELVCHNRCVTAKNTNQSPTSTRTSFSKQEDN